jgi:hypothetical protein
MFLDYAVGLALIVASLISPLSGSAVGAILLLAGVVEIITPTVSRWKWCVWPAVGMRAHSTADLVVAGLLVASGSVLIATYASSAACLMWAGSTIAALVFITRWGSLD